MKRDRRAKVAKSCGHILGGGNLMLLVFGEHTTVTLGLTVVLTVVLAPFTLAMALKLTAFLACSMTSLALGDRRERAELLVCAIGTLQPPSAGEKYREAMLAEIRDDLADEILRAITANLLITAPRTILAAWVGIPRPLWKWATRR